MKTFIVCKHPQSSQITFDLTSYLSSEKKSDAFFVYGLQNNTPNISRSTLPPNVVVKCAHDDKLEMDDLQREIVDYAPDTLLIINSVNVIATVIDLLLPKLREMASHVALYVDMPRQFPRKMHIDKIAAAKDVLQDRLSIYASDIGHFPNITKVLDYGIPDTFPVRVDARKNLGFPEDRKLVLSLGRTDTSIMMFAHVARQYPNAVLVIPVDVGSKDSIAEIFANEMGDMAGDDKIILVKSLQSLNNDEVATLFASVDCVVHANNVGDNNYYLRIASAMEIPQVIPDDSCTPFTFYAFDDVGGKISMYDSGDIGKLVCGALSQNSVNSERGAPERGARKWDDWKDILKEVVGESELEKCKRELEELRKMLKDLKTI